MLFTDQNKLISYVIPTLNSSATLEWTILSLKQQKFVDVRIIVVDSGSNDGTLEICQKWNIETYYVPPGNMYAAINYGLNLCETEWVAYLNSDDILYANSLSELIKNGDQNNADVVYGICDFIDVDGRFLYSFIPPKPQILAACMRAGGSSIAQQTVIFKKNMFDKLNGFNTEYKYAADYDFYARAISINSSFSFLEWLPVACFRIHKTQLSFQNHSEIIAEGRNIVIKILGPQRIMDKLASFDWKWKNAKNQLLKNLRNL
jgi:glycosyltransferase involved in cell wall biosynthesis